MNDKNGKGDTGKSAEKTFKLNEIKPFSKTFNTVASRFFHKKYDHFIDNFPGFHTSITRICQVEIPELSARYEARKKLMEADNGGKEVREEYLFHGTTEGNAYCICQKGFRCPPTPHRFGYSICFARDSRIFNRFSECCNRRRDQSHLSGTPGTSMASPGDITVQPPLRDREISFFTTPDAPRHCSHYMFLCKVLVGDSAHGQSFWLMKHPPFRPDNPNRLFDSCEGKGVSNGHVAVFDPDQAFPQYLIEYDNKLLSEFCDNVVIPHYMSRTFRK